MAAGPSAAEFGRLFAGRTGGLLVVAVLTAGRDAGQVQERPGFGVGQRHGVGEGAGPGRPAVGTGLGGRTLADGPVAWDE